MEPADPGRPGAQLSGEGFFRALLEADRDVTVVLGEGGVIRYATPSAAMLLGPGPAVGARLADLVGDGARAVVDREVRQMLGGAWAAPDPGEGEITWRIDGPGGRRVHVEVRCSDLPAAAAGGIVLTLRDVTSQREREEKLRRMAFHDTLTGLPNRVLFADRAWHAVAVARRTGTTAAVLFIDLDDFKDVNDTLGHAAGDELLKATATRLARAVRESDTAARLGGDEFAAVLETLPSPAAAGAFAGRIVKAFGEPFPLEGGQASVGVSVGVATTADSPDADGILACADRALYVVKASGKGGWLPFDASMTAMPPPRGRGKGPSAVGPAPAAARGAAGPRSPTRPRRAALAAVRLLQALLAAPGALPMPELARRAGVDDVTAYRALARLAAAGWLTAAPGRAAPGAAGGRPDASYALTAPGRAAAVSVAAAAGLGPQAGPDCPGPEI